MRLPDLIILSGQQLSNVVSVEHVSNGFIYSPAALDGTVTWQLSPNDGVTWYNIFNLTAGALSTLQIFHATHMRLSATINQTANRVTRVFGTTPDVA